MTTYSIHPTKQKLKNGSCTMVDSYKKKAIALGKELYGDDFILAEYKTDSWGKMYRTWRYFDHNGELLRNEKKEIVRSNYDRRT